MSSPAAPRSRPQLPEVTLVAITSVAVRATIDALVASMKQAEFGDVLLLTDQPPPPDMDRSINWKCIDRLGSRMDYSQFMLRQLGEHITTSHALCIQWDGFALNGQAWDPRFLDYDYIGAVWPQFSDGHNVGNGGFSLRSSRLLKACRDLPFDQSEVEDILIGRCCRAMLEQRGIRFAPASLASQFAYERAAPTGCEFGFHGAYNLVRYLPRKQAWRLFASLEPGMLAENEKLELFWWALKRGRIRLALAMLTRLA